jgi:hypothetical protein
MHAERERREKMDAAAQDFRLKPRLSTERDETALDRSAGAPQLFDNTNLIVGNVANDISHAQQDRQHNQPDHDRDRR